MKLTNDGISIGLTAVGDMHATDSCGDISAHDSCGGMHATDSCGDMLFTPLIDVGTHHFASRVYLEVV